MATATAPRELVEDRYKGLMFAMEDVRKEPGERNYLEICSELYDRLDDALTELVFGLVRHDVESVVGPIVDELHEAIQKRAVQLASVDVASRATEGAAA